MLASISSAYFFLEGSERERSKEGETMGNPTLPIKSEWNVTHGLVLLLAAVFTLAINMGGGISFLLVLIGVGR